MKSIFRNIFPISLINFSLVIITIILTIIFQGNEAILKAGGVLIVIGLLVIITYTFIGLKNLFAKERSKLNKISLILNIILLLILVITLYPG